MIYRSKPKRSAPEEEGKGTWSWHERGVPRIVKLLDRIVTAYAPGGRVAWKSEKRKNAKLLSEKRNVKLSLHSSILAQSAKTRAILLPSGDLIPRNVAQNCLALFLVIEESFPRFFDQVPFDSQLTLIETVNSWPKDELEKRFKNLLVWPLAYFKRQELPEVHSAQECRNLGFKGKAAQWLRNLFVARRNRRNERFFWALLQGVKRACAPISEEFIAKAYVKHQKGLTKSLGPEEFDDLELFRFGRRLWQGASSSYELPPPSFSASFRSTRASGGKLAEIRRTKLEKVSKSRSISSQPALLEGDAGNDDLSDETDSQRGRILSQDGNSQMESTVLIDHEGELRRATYVEVSRDEALNHYLQSPFRKKTRVEMVIEPLKARPITAGDAHASWISMEGQRKMHSHLKKMAQCSLIGEPLNPEHLEWIEANSPEGFDYWVSGDYSAATDNLDVRVTKRLFESFLYWQPVSEDLETAWREMLYEQELLYPDGTSVWQTTGQLMGSPLSFPILCAANLFCYVQTWKRVFGTEPALRKLPVLINGDDILFKASPQFYEVWQSEIKKVGFELSVGKSYFSKEFLTINSKYYRCKGSANHSKKSAGLVDGRVTKCDVKTFELVSFFNPAQVLPWHYLSREEEKVQEGDSSDPLTGRLSDALNRTINPRFVFERFKFFNQRHVRMATQNGRLNLFIHRNLGGLGVDASGLKFKITRFQRQLATCLNSTQQAGIVKLTSSTILQGLVSPDCAQSAVRATVPPAPSKILPTNFGHDLQRSGRRFWQVEKIPCFGKLRSKNSSLLSEETILDYVGTTEITKSQENDDLLSYLQEREDLIPFCTLKGSVAGVKVWRWKSISCHLDSI